MATETMTPPVHERDAHAHTQPVVGREPRNAHIIKDDLHTTGKIAELGTDMEVRARRGARGADSAGQGEGAELYSC